MVIIFGFGRTVDIVDKYYPLGSVIFLWGVSMCTSRKGNDWEPALGVAGYRFRFGIGCFWFCPRV